MAKFSIARQPYYIAVAIFCGLSALVMSFLNDSATGTESDVYLGLMVCFGALAAWSGYYLVATLNHGDDDVGIEIAGLPAGKGFYYIAVLAACVYRAFIGYQMNHNATGVDSFYGKVWFVASVIIAIFTYANYKSYAATHPTFPLDSKSSLKS